MREIEALTAELRVVEAKANFEEGFARLQSSRHRRVNPDLSEPTDGLFAGGPQ